MRRNIARSGSMRDRKCPVRCPRAPVTVSSPCSSFLAAVEARRCACAAGRCEARPMIENVPLLNPAGDPECRSYGYRWWGPVRGMGCLASSVGLIGLLVAVNPSSGLLPLWQPRVMRCSIVDAIQSSNSKYEYDLSGADPRDASWRAPTASDRWQDGSTPDPADALCACAPRRRRFGSHLPPVASPCPTLLLVCRDSGDRRRRSPDRRRTDP